ncbi:glutathione S-transferase D1 isoform X2 [Apis florea]|uniref:glutathione S-transferase D1 isoform X2 n=1 Tax=Apis florea TaxID=7463 RepID=UPI0012FEC13C|nr:glutathione S-transferase D1 isoform X2 [Apis florea]
MLLLDNIFRGAFVERRKRRSRGEIVRGVERVSRGSRVRSRRCSHHRRFCHPHDHLRPLEIKMPIDFYQLLGSPPCRAVALTAAAFGIEMNFKKVDLLNGEHLKPEFLKMNPQHTIPTIDDNGFYLWKGNFCPPLFFSSRKLLNLSYRCFPFSRAIMMYLADQYGKNDSLYPKDLKKRAIINQRLYFDVCNLYKSFADYYYPMIFAKAAKDQAKYESIGTALSLLDKFLEGENYVAGKNITLADLSIVTTVSTIEVMDYDLGKYKNVTRWFAKMKSEIPKYEEYNNAGLKMFKALADEKLSKK